MKLTPLKLLTLQIIAHLSIIPMILYAGIFEYTVSLVVYFFTGCLGMVAGYHRLLSHRSWPCHEILRKAITLFATVGLTGSAIAWVAVHREHHRYTDTEKDPHSPMHKGIFFSHFLSMYAPVRMKYVKDLLRDSFMLWQHNNYILINIVYALCLFIVDPFALVYAWLFPAMILWNAGSSLVSISHRKNKIHNDLITILMTWGDGWHETHHKNSRLYRLHKCDITGWLIDHVLKKQ